MLFVPDWLYESDPLWNFRSKGRLSFVFAGADDRLGLESSCHEKSVPGDAQP